jgi:hypothetical protein
LLPFGVTEGEQDDPVYEGVAAELNRGDLSR